MVLASDVNKHCSWPFIKIPDSIYADLKVPFNLPDDQSLCIQPIDWKKTALSETEKGSGVYVGTAPAAKKDGHWVGYYIELTYEDDTHSGFHWLFKPEYYLTTPGFVTPDTLPFDDCHLDTCVGHLV